ncbi:MAG TPA: AI-2E family transporter [Candidatus Limnocylindrales bacterium]|jgi:predicted PurR-regulated permease PerM|nr:AI-2E family transporter [Candidatus Limnocylindrales bacterium]
MTLSRDPAARTRARGRWTTLAERLQTVSPESVVKGVIAAGVVGAGIWLSIASWPALAPFLAGAVIAYAVLPIANRLDRIMPRVLAALLAELVAVAILVGVLLIVVPPVLGGLVQVALKLPSGDQIQAQLASLQAQLGELPEPLRSIVTAVVTESLTNLQGALDGFVDSAASVVSSQILGVFNTLSFVLGLLVIPAWILTLVSDERAIKRHVASLLPPVMRPDAIALASIADRVFGTFLRVRVVLAIVSGLIVWGGLELTNAIGLTDVRYTATAGTLLGFLQLIPELGYFLGFFPILLFIPVSGPGAAAAALVVYVIAVKIADSVMGTRVARGVLDVHPGLLIPAIVVLSQFGAIWLIAAAPLIALVRDLVRYAYGRLGDPPLPAGVLPGRPVRRSAPAAPVPSVYRSATGRAAVPVVAGANASAAPTLAATARPRPALPTTADASWRPGA